MDKKRQNNNYIFALVIFVIVVVLLFYSFNKEETISTVEVDDIETGFTKIIKQQRFIKGQKISLGGRIKK